MPDTSEKLVRTVNSVDVHFVHSTPPQLAVTAFGTVPTTGWTKAHLVQRSPDHPPADGVYEFDEAP